MRLSARLVAAVLIGVIALLFLDSWFSVKREIRLFDTYMERDALHLGGVVATLITQVWEEEGEDDVRELIASVNRENFHVRARLVWLDGSPESTHGVHLDAGERAGLRAGRAVSVKRDWVGRGRHRFTYVPLTLSGAGPAAVELAEPLDELAAYTRHSVVQSVILGVLVLLVGSLALWLLGVHLVGRPLERLVEKTRRIGRGDLSGDLVLRGGDELGSLAVAINEMCRQLEEAQERIRAENEARIAALEQLRHSERLATLGRVASGIAHELGTPLNVVSGRAQLIASEGLPREDAVSSARVIERQAARMARIIRQLLDYARRPSSTKAEVAMGDVIRGALEILAPTAQKKNVRLELREALPLPTVVADRAQIEQVVINILVNAIHAMNGAGSVEVELSPAAERPPQRPEVRPLECVAIRIRDEGVGIPPDQLGQVFEPFYTTKATGEGTGLGLSVAKEIVEEHGGWIEVQSEVGKGACFSVFLPVERHP